MAPGGLPSSMLAAAFANEDDWDKPERRVSFTSQLDASGGASFLTDAMHTIALNESYTYMTRQRPQATLLSAVQMP